MRLQASCFGKLPCHADFIRHQSGPELSGFDRWLQAGMLSLRETLGDAWEAAYTGGPLVRFLRYLPKEKRVLVGVTMPSKGKAQRDYPFVIATTLQDKAVLKEPALVPILCEEFLDGAAALMRGEPGQSAREVQAAVEALSREVDVKRVQRQFAAYLEQTTQEVLLTATLGAWDNRRYLLYESLKELRTASGDGVYGLPRAQNGPIAAMWFAALSAARGKAGFPSLLTWAPQARGGEKLVEGDELRFVVSEPAGSHLDALLLRQRPQETTLEMELAKRGNTVRLRNAQMSVGALAGEGSRPMGTLIKTLRSS